MAIDMTALRAEAATLFSKYEATIDKAATEGRDLTPEEKAETDAQFARYTFIQDTEARQTKLAGMAFAKGNAQRTAEPPGRAAAILSGETPPPDGLGSLDYSTAEGRQAIGRAFGRWVQTGQMDPRFATVTSATANSALLPKDVARPRIAVAPSTLREALAAVGSAPLKTTSTADISIPVVNPAGGSVLTANQQGYADNSPDFSASIYLKILQVQSGPTYFSNLILEAQDFDLIESCLPALDYSKELALEAYAMNKIATDATIVQRVSTATVSGLTYNNMVDLNRVPPKRYAFQTVIILSKAAFIAVEKLTDTQGRPILNPDAQNSSLKRFNGTPVLYTDLMPNGGTFGANQVIGFIASMIGFVLRDAGDQPKIEQYPPLPERPNQRGLNEIGYHSIGYDSSAMALLVCPAQ